jgi:hypothetical protein
VTVAVWSLEFKFQPKKPQTEPKLQLQLQTEPKLQLQTEPKLQLQTELELKLQTATVTAELIFSTRQVPGKTSTFGRRGIGLAVQTRISYKSTELHRCSESLSGQLLASYRQVSELCVTDLLTTWFNIETLLICRI